MSFKKRIVGGEILIYKGADKLPMLEVRFKDETIWLTQQQVSQLFGIKRPAITKHLRHIFQSGELKESSVCSILEHTANDGKKYHVQYYNLDAVLSVGYRVNSKQATLFRQWATKILRQHITKGFSINPSVVKRHYAEFQKAVDNIRHLLPPNAVIDNASVLELVSVFANTWLSLQAYDSDELPSKGITKKSITITADRLAMALAGFREVLIKRREASDLFGIERNAGNIAGIVGNIMQSFGGQSMYATIEEKAAHLLYFMVKNHPLVDGNKRSGAYAFVWFLQQAKILDRSKMSPAALTAITILIAESNPKHKERMIGLVLQMLKK